MSQSDKDTPKIFSVDFIENTTKNTACQFHNAYELCYFSAGSRTYIVNEEVYDAVPCSFILIPPYVQHSTCGTEAVTRTVIYFNKELLLDYFSEAFTDVLISELSMPIFSLTVGYEGFSRTVEQLQAAYSEHRESSAALFLAELLLAVREAKRIPPKQKSETVQSTVARALKYIESNFYSIESLDEIAKELRVSLSYLEASFRKNTGISLMQYVIKTRINYASRLLLEGKKSITEISLLCGFNSSTHFSNTFKKHTGVSPRAYRG